MAGESPCYDAVSLPPQQGAQVSQKTRRERLRWTARLHAAFVDSVAALGGSHLATPKEILRHMDSQGTGNALTVDHIKSHLQKYRTCLKVGKLDETGPGDDSAETEPRRPSSQADILCRIHDELLRHDKHREARALPSYTTCLSAGNANDSGVSTDAEPPALLFQHASVNKAAEDDVKNTWTGDGLADSTVVVKDETIDHHARKGSLCLLHAEPPHSMELASSLHLPPSSRGALPSYPAPPPTSSPAHVEALHQAFTAQAQLEAAMRNQLNMQLELQARLQLHGNCVEELTPMRLGFSAVASPAQQHQHYQQHQRLLLLRQHQQLAELQERTIRLRSELQGKAGPGPELHLTAADSLCLPLPLPAGPPVKPGPQGLDLSRAGSTTAPSAPTMARKRGSPEPSASLDLKLAAASLPAPAAACTAQPYPSPDASTLGPANPKRLRCASDAQLDALHAHAHSSAGSLSPLGPDLDLSASPHLQLSLAMHMARQRQVGLDGAIHSSLLASMHPTQVGQGGGGIGCCNPGSSSGLMPYQAMQPIQFMQPMQPMQYILVPGSGGSHALLAVMAAPGPMQLLQQAHGRPGGQAQVQAHAQLLLRPVMGCAGGEVA